MSKQKIAENLAVQNLREDFKSRELELPKNISIEELKLPPAVLDKLVKLEKEEQVKFFQKLANQQEEKTTWTRFSGALKKSAQAFISSYEVTKVLITQVIGFILSAASLRNPTTNWNETGVYLREQSRIKFKNSNWESSFPDEVQYSKLGWFAKIQINNPLSYLSTAIFDPLYDGVDWLKNSSRTIIINRSAGTNISIEDFEEISRTTPALRISNTLFNVAEILLGIASVAASGGGALFTGGRAARFVLSSAGFGFASSLGNELVNYDTVDYLRLAEGTIDTTAKSNVFSGLLSLGTKAYVRKSFKTTLPKTSQQYVSLANNSKDELLKLDKLYKRAQKITSTVDFVDAQKDFNSSLSQFENESRKLNSFAEAFEYRNIRKLFGASIQVATAAYDMKSERASGADKHLSDAREEISLTEDRLIAERAVAYRDAAAILLRDKLKSQDLSSSEARDLAKCFIETKDYKQALVFIKRSGTTKVRDELFSTMALELAKDGRISTSLKCINRIKSTKKVETLFACARIAHENKNVRAEKIYLKEAPNFITEMLSFVEYAEVLADLGYKKSAKKQLQEARKLFISEKEKIGYRSDFLCSLHIVAKKLGQEKFADRLFNELQQEFLKEEFDLKELLNVVSCLTDKGEYKTAYKLYDTHFQRLKKFLNIVDMIVISAAKKNDPDFILELLENEIQKRRIESPYDQARIRAYADPYLALSQLLQDAKKIVDNNPAEIIEVAGRSCEVVRIAASIGQLKSVVDLVRSMPSGELVVKLLYDVLSMENDLDYQEIADLALKIGNADTQAEVLTHAACLALEKNDQNKFQKLYELLDQSWESISSEKQYYVVSKLFLVINKIEDTQIKSNLFELFTSFSFMHLGAGNVLGYLVKAVHELKILVGKNSIAPDRQMGSKRAKDALIFLILLEASDEQIAEFAKEHQIDLNDLSGYPPNTQEVIDLFGFKSITELRDFVRKNEINSVYFNMAVSPHRKNKLRLRKEHLRSVDILNIPYLMVESFLARLEVDEDYLTFFDKIQQGIKSTHSTTRKFAHKDLAWIYVDFYLMTNDIETQSSLRQAIDIFGHEYALKFLRQNGVIEHDACLALNAFIELRKNILNFVELGNIEAPACFSVDHLYHRILSQVILDTSIKNEKTAIERLKLVAENIWRHSGVLRVRILKNKDALQLSEERLRAAFKFDKLEDFYRGEKHIYLNYDHILKSWKNLEEFYEFQRKVEKEDSVSFINSLKGSGKLQDFARTLCYHPDSNVSLDVVEQFCLKPEEFLARGDTQTDLLPETKLLHQKLKVSNYTEVPFLDLLAKELVAALANEDLDQLQLFQAMSVDYKVVVHQGRVCSFDSTLGILSLAAAESGKSLCKNRTELLRKVRKMFQEGKVDPLPNLLNGQTKLTAAGDQKLREELFNKQYGLNLEPSQIQELSVEVVKKSNPLALISGDDTGTCKQFGSGKENIFIFNHNCGQVLFRLKTKDGHYRTIAEAVLTKSLKIKVNAEDLYAWMLKSDALVLDQSEILADSYLTLDNIEILKNYNEANYAHALTKVCADFFGSYLRHYAAQMGVLPEKILVGANTELTNFKKHEVSSEENSYFPISPMSYIDNRFRGVFYLNSSESSGLAQEFVVPDKESPVRLESESSLTSQDTILVEEMERRAIHYSIVPGERRKGLCKINNILVATEINNHLKSRPNLNLKVKSRKGNYLEACMLAYQGVDQEQKPVIYISDFLSTGDEVIEERLIDEFVELYKKHYLETGNIIPLVTTAENQRFLDRILAKILILPGSW